MQRTARRLALFSLCALATPVLAQRATPIAHRRLPAASRVSRVPTPESHFGFPVGADYRLFDYEQSIAYFRQLAAASDRIRLIDVGRTSTGKPWTVAIISSPANLAKLDQYRRMNMRLAHPEGGGTELDSAGARRLARDGKIIVDISGGLHASEIAGSQHTPLLAYRLLSAPNEGETREILDNVILFLWPTINPDGQDIVVDWCRARDAGAEPGPMELYQKYIGHDNNRDSYMLNVVESRVIQRTWREWEPDIIYVHHQSSPFPTRIWIPPFADPSGLHAPPIPAREINTIGMQIAQTLDAEGKPGAVHALATFDAWYPGYIDYMPVYQNIPAWWTETQGGNCATPRTTTLDSLPPEYRDLRPTPFYLSPWPQGTWRLRDAVEYMVTASRATLLYAARYREQLLYNRYQSGRDVIRTYRSGAPYAYVVPQAQHDPVAPVELLRRLALLGLRVYQATRDVAYAGTTYPQGTWVIPMDQEYAELARELLDPQRYPDLGEDLPYDAAGWTLPYQMHVNVIAGGAPLGPDVRAALRLVEGKAVDWRTAPDEPFETNAEAAGIVPAPTSYGVTGAGDRLLLDPAQNNAFRLLNRALAAGGTVRRLPPDGGGGARYVVSGVDPAALDGWAAALWVRGERVPASSVEGAAPVGTRLALYEAAPGNMDEGWTEWLLDTFGFQYTLIGPADLRAGDPARGSGQALAGRFDVVVLASQGPTSNAGGRGGFGGGGRASPPETPDSVRARAADDSARVRALDAFVRGGGTVVTWNQGTMPTVDALHLPVRNAVAGLRRQEYFTGGSIMRVTVDTTHPVMAGMPARADVFVNDSPVFTTADGFQGTVLAHYASEGSPLRSGFLTPGGEKRMQGNAAALDVRHGAGHVVLIAFQPQWRGQPTGTFRVVFNAMLAGR